MIKVILDMIQRSKNDYKYIIIDGAVLHKINMQNIIDLTIKIKASEIVRMNRIVKRDNISKDKVIERFNSYEDCNNFDIELLNDGNIDTLTSQIDAILDKK